MGKHKKKRAKERREKQEGTGSKAPTWADNLTGFLSGLRSTDKKAREHSCVAVASMFGAEKEESAKATKKQIQHCISTGVVKMLLNCLSDPVTPVSLEAAGALRNLSVAGGMDLCEYLVAKDAMTPLLAQLQKVTQRLMSALTDGNSHHAVQVIAVLSNLCESSGVAVMYFTDCGGALDGVLALMNPDVFSEELTLVAAQLLHVVLDQNESCAQQLMMIDGAVTALLQQLSSASAPLRFRLYAAAILIHLQEHTAQMTPHLQTVMAPLAEALQADVAVLLAPRPPPAPVATPAASAGGSSKEKEGGGDSMAVETDAATGDVVVDSVLDVSMDGKGNPTLAQKDGASVAVSDAEYYTKQTQSLVLALEILTNLCSADRGAGEDDEQWAQAQGQGAAPAFAPGVVAALEIVASSNCFAHVMSVLDRLCKQLCVSSSSSSSSSSSMDSSSSSSSIGPDGAAGPIGVAIHRACCCLGNMLQNLPVPALALPATAAATAVATVAVSGAFAGGGEPLLSAYASVSELAAGVAHAAPTLAFHSAGGAGQEEDGPPQDTPMASLTSVLWAALRRSAGAMSLPMGAVEVLLQWAQEERCACSQTRVHAVGMIGTLGQRPHDQQQNKLLGGGLRGALSDSSLLVVAETLNSIFDVYAEEQYDVSFVELGLQHTLQEELPRIGKKIAQEGRSMDPDSLDQCQEAHSNLRRFLQYKTQHIPHTGR